MKATIELPAEALCIVAAPPLWISQFTCESTLGLRRRTYLELAIRYRASGGEVICAGRTRLVQVDRFVDWLRDRARCQPGPDAELAEAVQRCGLRLAAGAGR